MAPIKTELIKLPKCELFNNFPLISIDSGRWLTKILFLNKRDQNQFLNKNEDVTTLEFALFRNDDFMEALERIKTFSCQQKGGINKVHITGTFALENKEKIKSFLNIDVIYFDELLTLKVGHKIVLEHIGIDKLLVKDVDYGEKYEIKMFEQHFSGWKNKSADNENYSGESILYPCLFNVHGPLCGFLYFDEHGIPEYHNVLNDGTMNLLGLAKCLLDTNDFEEIMDLASRGDVSHVDTQIKEILDIKVNSPYGKFPPEMPIFSFGKCMDYNKGLECLAKEDLSLALVSFQMNNLLSQCIGLAVIKNVSKIYLTGNLFISEIFQREIRKVEQIFPSTLDIKVLNFGYFGALGAMACDQIRKEETCV